MSFLVSNGHLSLPVTGGGGFVASDLARDLYPMIRLTSEFG